MEALEDSNCHSLSDSFSLYERYMRSFNVVDTFLEDNNNPQASGHSCSSDNSDEEHSNGISNVVTSLQKNALTNPSHAFPTAFSCVNDQNTRTDVGGKKSLDDNIDFSTNPQFPRVLLEDACLMDNSVTDDSRLTEKSDPIDTPVSSEDTKSDHSKHPKPVIITSFSTMENSNNAVDSVPMFRDVRPSESIFKLPIRELSFNGTLKHVQKLKPIVDPIRALTSVPDLVSEGTQPELLHNAEPSMSEGSEQSGFLNQKSDSTLKSSDMSEDRSQVNRLEDMTESTGDSQYKEFISGKEVLERDNTQNRDQSYSSLDASFDSGVRSPDMFSDYDHDELPEPDEFWYFLKEFEANDKLKVRKMEETLQGVLPPPSVTIIKTDVTDMLKKYYSFLPAFVEDTNVCPPEFNDTTPTKRTSFVRIPTDTQLPDALQETTETYNKMSANIDNNEPVAIVSTEILKIESVEAESIVMPKVEPIEKPTSSVSKESIKFEPVLNTSVNEKKVELKMSSEVEVKESQWPDVLKCRFYDVHFNITQYSERMELLAMRCGERFVGAETDSTVTVYSGGLQSPSSACKRKAMRLKMAQAKSPGSRLSHLARRRQAFCSAATIGEKAHTSTSKMVLIDKKKLISSAEWRSPRLRRTPGKRTPARKTPGKKTPAKTPKTRSGGTSRKKAMRRLLMDPETLTRSQPTRETSKRALFVSPENRKPIPQAPSTSVPLQAMKSKRALFGSPVRPAGTTKSLDDSQSDVFLKRKRDLLDDSQQEHRRKLAKSLSFGGDSFTATQGPSLSRRASEMMASKSNVAELDALHRKKLCWAVSEALRIHGWRMQSPGFREMASSLAQLTRRLIELPQHAARLAAPKLSTSETILKIARQYVYDIIQGRSVEDCYQDEQKRLANDGTHKVTGYVTASAYQQFKARQAAAASSFQSQIKENNFHGIKQEQPKSGSKNILQDKLLNVDSNSNSSSGLSLLDKTGLYKSNSMPSFEEAAKMRARRQISFDNVDFPKR